MSSHDFPSLSPGCLPLHNQKTLLVLSCVLIFFVAGAMCDFQIQIYSGSVRPSGHPASVLCTSTFSLTSPANSRLGINAKRPLTTAAASESSYDCRENALCDYLLPLYRGRSNLDQGERCI